MSDLGCTRTDLCSIRAGAEQAEFADAVRGLLSADGCRQAGGDPLAPLGRDGARTLVEAGFTLHHCDRHDPLWRLGGVCLISIPAEFGTGRSGIAVSWTTHNLLLLDWDRRATYYRTRYRTRDLMNAVLAGVLHAFGYPIRQLGTGGAWLVIGHRGQRTGAGR
jgi:hypothetical protein